MLSKSFRILALMLAVFLTAAFLACAESSDSKKSGLDALKESMQQQSDKKESSESSASKSSAADRMAEMMKKKQEAAPEGGKAAQIASMSGGQQNVVVGFVKEGLAHVTDKAVKKSADECEYEGYDLEVVEEILIKAGYKKYSFVEVTAQEALTLLDKGEITLLMGYRMDEALLSRVVEVSSGNELALADNSEKATEEEAEFAKAAEGTYFRTVSYLSGKETETLDGGESVTLESEYYLIGTGENAKVISAFDRNYEKVYVNGFIDETWDKYFETTWLYRVWRGIRKAGFSVWRQFRMNLIEENRYQMILTGLGRTLLIAVSSAVIGVLVGCVIALMRLSNAHIGKWKFLQSISSIYVDVIRGTPVVVQLMIMYYVILTSPDISKLTVSVITFGLNSAAYVSEMVRGGILAVDKGQTEAGRSLGLSASATMLLIVLPQTIKIIIPSLFNEIIMLLKETSVVGFIGYMDLTKAGDFIRSRTYSAFFPLLTVAAVYLIIVTVLTRVFNRVERRLRQSDIR